MALRTEIFRVSGMTCASCERRIEQALAFLPGVETVIADRGSATVRVEFDPARVAPPALAARIAAEGYSVGKDRMPILGLAIGVLLSLGYLLASRAGLFGNFPLPGESLGLGALFVIGLLTSVHCVAMCGGIVLGQTAPTLPAPPLRDAAPDSANARLGSLGRRLGPAFRYNLGRVLSYTATGALVGALGSVLDFAPALQAAIMAGAALLMIAYGLRSIGVLRLSAAHRLPAARRLFAAKHASSAPGSRLARLTTGRGPLVVGLLNGFMPCGPLQSMQLFALGTGSAIGGAAAMLAFGLGTAPLLLGLGAVASFVPRKALPAAARASGVLVLVLGVATAGRAAALAGIPLPRIGIAASPRSTALAEINRPAASSEDRLETIPKIPGPRIPARKPGFGMALAALPAQLIGAEEDAAGAGGLCPCCAAGGSGSGLGPETGTSAPAGAALAVPVQLGARPRTEPIRAQLAGGTQTVVTPVGSRSYPPFIVKAGIPVRWIIRARAEDLNGCNNAIVIPALRLRQALKPGDTVIEFTPEKTGRVPFSCWMGMIRSEFIVE